MILLWTFAEVKRPKFKAERKSGTKTKKCVYIFSYWFSNEHKTSDYLPFCGANAKKAYFLVDVFNMKVFFSSPCFFFNFFFWSQIKYFLLWGNAAQYCFDLFRFFKVVWFSSVLQSFMNMNLNMNMSNVPYDSYNVNVSNTWKITNSISHRLLCIYSLLYFRSNHTFVS